MVGENCSEKRGEKSRQKRDREEMVSISISISGVRCSNERSRKIATLLNWFLEACSMSRARSLMKCPQSWYFSGGPDIIVSQTGSDTRGIVYRLQMVVLRAVRTQRHKSFCHQQTQRMLQFHRAALQLGKTFTAYFNCWTCHASWEYGLQSTA